MISNKNYRQFLIGILVDHTNYLDTIRDYQGQQISVSIKDLKLSNEPYFIEEI